MGFLPPNPNPTVVSATDDCYLEAVTQNSDVIRKFNVPLKGIIELCLASSLKKFTAESKSFTFNGSKE